MRELTISLPQRVNERLFRLVDTKTQEARRLGIPEPYLKADTAGLVLTGANSTCTVHPFEDQLWLWWSRVKAAGIRLTLDPYTRTCLLATRATSLSEIEQLLTEMEQMTVAIESQTFFGYFEKGLCIALIDDTESTFTGHIHDRVSKRTALGHEPNLYLGTGHPMPEIFRQQDPAQFFKEFWKLIPSGKITRLKTQQLGDGTQFHGREGRIVVRPTTTDRTFAAAAPYVHWDIKRNRPVSSTHSFTWPIRMTWMRP